HRLFRRYGRECAVSRVARPANRAAQRHARNLVAACWHGSPDGAVVDADGLIWNARWGGGCIDVYSPQGEHLRCLHVPARQPTCPAFVGPNLSRLLVTSAWCDLDETARAAGPQAGCTFLLDVAARGRGEPDVKLASA